MPLIKRSSTAAREKNIQTELAHGKPPKQAVAIAYAVQRRAQHTDRYTRRSGPR
jgi:hypothetical protein